MTLKRINRREAIGHTVLTGAALCLGARRATAGTSPNGKLNIAIVGCGGKGGDNLKGVAGENIVALCDVNKNILDGSAAQFPRAKKFQDFRKMFDAMHAQIDAVVVSTPDHMHAPISLTAMQLGKHIYCEKPLTWSIEEARLMAKAAKEQKLATQMGTQGMAMDHSRAGIEVLRSGVLGKIQEIHVWTDRAKKYWPQGVDRPADTPPVPGELDWDLWLGAAPQRPYHPIYVPFRWRGWKDFGTGAVGDMGIHNAAVALAALRLGAPRSVEIMETSGLKNETYPAWSKLRCEFPAAAGQKPVVLYWYDGGKLPSDELIGRKVAANGSIVVGTEGTFYSQEWTGSRWFLFPEDKFHDYKQPGPSVPRAPEQNHHKEWILACKGGALAFCNFVDFAAPLTETMLVGTLALRIGKALRWDAGKMQAEGCPEAEPFIRRAYRKGWEL